MHGASAFKSSAFRHARSRSARPLIKQAFDKQMSDCWLINSLTEQNLVKVVVIKSLGVVLAQPKFSDLCACSGSLGRLGLQVRL